MGPLAIDSFESAWNKIEPHQALFNNKCRYDEWYHYGDIAAGMRRKENGQIEGIVRIISSRFVWEASYKDAKLHGLYREVGVNRTYIRLYKNGSCLAEISFNRQLIEQSRKGPENIIVGLIPSNLQLVQTKIRTAIKDIVNQNRQDEEERKRQLKEAEFEARMKERLENWKQIALQNVWPECQWILQMELDPEHSMGSEAEMAHY